MTDCDAFLTPIVLLEDKEPPHTHNKAELSNYILIAGINERQNDPHRTFQHIIFTAEVVYAIKYLNIYSSELI